MVALEKHHDRFNIDWIRYFRKDSFITCLLISTIVTAVWINWISVWDLSLTVPFNTVSLLVVLGVICYLVGLTTIAYLAGTNLEEAMRLAARRGLFSFAIMTNVILVVLICAGHLTWQDPFKKTLTLIFTAEIMCGLTACAADLLVPMIRHWLRR